MVDWRVPLADIDYGGPELEAVQSVLEGRWLTMGAITQEFESTFAGYLGLKHAVAVSNATAALHLACLSLGIGPGDEVIVPSLTFVATANAVLYTGADVRFADISGPGELNISPAEIELCINERTKAILLVHYGGYPCRMVEIMAIARRNGLAVVEDAAHAPGASLDDKYMGAWGDGGCFSFFSNKNVATGEGGMLVTDRDDIAERARLLRSHGMTSLTWDRHQGHAFSYDVVDLGYNYRLDEIRAALGLVQLGKLEGNNARRKAITYRYWEGLEELGLKLPQRLVPGEPSFHIFPLLLPPGMDRHKFMEDMRTAGVQTSIHYPPVHTFSYYQGRYPGVRLPQTEDVATREVTLPLYPGMDEESVDYVLASVRQALGHHFG